MRTPGMIVVLVLAAGILAGAVSAMQHEPSIDKGKALFNSTKLGKNDKTCNDCHRDGSGLENAGTKSDLETIVNNCIRKGLNGKALKSKSVEMQSLLLYIRSLGSEKKPSSKKTPVGC